MPPPGGVCPRCGRGYAWGVTVCSACHVGLEPPTPSADPEPLSLVLETWDRPSAAIVSSLLTAHGIRCLVRGGHDSVHIGLGASGGFRLYVRAAEAPQAQEILDAEIGRGEEEG